MTSTVAPHRTTAAPSERVRVRRAHKKAAYDLDTIAAILDEALVAHLGFAHEGQPFVIPTLHARIGDRVFVHGSSASRTLRALGGGGLPACLTVTLVDGLVYARSIFEMSTNYRSVVILGDATPVTDHDEKLEALRAFSEQVMPGRWDAVAPPDPPGGQGDGDPLPAARRGLREGLVRRPGRRRVARTRRCPSGPDTCPVRMVAGDPVPCPHLPAGIPVPDDLLRPQLRA